MITIDDVKQISQKISSEMGLSDDKLWEDIYCIVYRVDVFPCDDKSVISRHIDVQYLFGEYYEVQENTSLYEFICTMCNLPLLYDEKEIIIFQKRG